MIFDKRLTVDTNRSLVHTGTGLQDPVPSASSIDKGLIRDIAEGNPLFIHFHFTEAVVGTDILLLGVAEDDTEALAGGAFTFHALGTDFQVPAATKFTLGTRVIVPVPPRLLLTPKRYIGATYFYMGSANITAGKVTTSFVYEYGNAPRTYPDAV